MDNIWYDGDEYPDLDLACTQRPKPYGDALADQI